MEGKALGPEARRCSRPLSGPLGSLSLPISEKADLSCDTIHDASTAICKYERKCFGMWQVYGEETLRVTKPEGAITVSEH